MSGAKVLQSDGYWLNYKPSLWAGFDYLEAPITGLGGFHIKFNPQVYTALQARLFNGSIPFILK